MSIIIAQEYVKNGLSGNGNGAVFLSLYSSPTNTRQGWTAYATQAEAEECQSRFLPGWADGIRRVERRPGYEPGDTWTN